MQAFGRSLFVLGGARSGKSRHAQAAAESLGGDLVFIATAQAFDAEMTAKIARHRADRGPRWRTVEASIDLAGAIEAAGVAGTVLLVDCLTLWASNLLLAGEDGQSRTDALLSAIALSPARIILVSNEVGLGIVPDNALARRFRDLAGEINQRVAAAVDTVDLAVAGLTLRLK
ncbi:MAG: bifunctional adenosylcobinamide kinase/adenosylcobinamide-phosphate guanylyltransferase [Candidatus Sphingomonas phytovorans]|nr:bifunctional adenosylcobinamide kinase/adenosylcobinamide-phosphate guanylyltransferase [Sphingomonas sp.]WEJ99706.1 MAG: bifunctional adenosylcobinamide kinase/adenosylcobinamide-phosphate guanylyltransferase [Sphingomonas sp.]